MVGGYVIAVTLARELGPSDYGIYGVIMSVLVWLEMASASGIPAATARLLPEYESRAAELEQTAKAFLLAVCLALFVLCWFLAPWLTALFHIPAGTTLFRIAILDLPLTGVYNAYQGILNGHRRFGVLSVGFITYSLTKVAGILALVALGLSVSGALVVNVLATVGVMVYMAFRVPFTRAWPTYTALTPLLRLALPFGLSLAVLQVLLNLDLWSLKSLWMGGGEVVGMYVASLNISKMMTAVPMVMGSVLFASLSHALARKNKILAQTYLQAALRFTLVLLVPCCLLLAQHAEDLMAFLYSNVYSPGGAYLRLQVVAFGLFAVFDLLENAIGAAGKYYRSLTILVSLVPVAFMLNRVLIPRFGATGAAGSVAITMCIGTALVVLVAHHQFGSLIKFLTLLRIAGATAVMGFLAKQVTVVGFWLPVKFAVLLGVYVLLLALSRELKWQDLKGFALWQRNSRQRETDQPEKETGVEACS
jgi:O-antigen/teichoic acid export membrane protein